MVSEKNLTKGSGESGKSTFFKQIKILFVNGYTKEELFAIRDTVRENIIKSMKLLCKAVSEKEGLQLQESNLENAKAITEFQIDDALDKTYTKQIIQQLSELWKDETIQKAMEFKSEYQILDSAE